jgi:hypothetical protein
MSARPRGWRYQVFLLTATASLIVSSMLGAASAQEAADGEAGARDTATWPPSGVRPAEPSTPGQPRSGSTDRSSDGPSSATRRAPTIHPPANLRVVSAGPQPGMYTLTWVPPDNETAVEYHIMARGQGEEQAAWFRAPGSANQTVLGGLDPSGSYSLVIMAVDTLGQESATSNTVLTTGAPAATPVSPAYTPTPPTYNTNTVPYAPGVLATGPAAGPSSPQAPPQLGQAPPIVSSGQQQPVPVPLVAIAAPTSSPTTVLSRLSPGSGSPATPISAPAPAARSDFPSASPSSSPTGAATATPSVATVTAPGSSGPPPGSGPTGAATAAPSVAAGPPPGGSGPPPGSGPTGGAAATPSVAAGPPPGGSGPPPGSGPTSGSRP